MHKNNFYGTAPLAVKRQRAQEAFRHRQLQVGVRQNNGRVFGLQAQNRAQTVGLGMSLFQFIRRLAGADKGQHVNFTGAHEWGGDLPSPAVDRIDYSGGKESRKASRRG